MSLDYLFYRVGKRFNALELMGALAESGEGSRFDLHRAADNLLRRWARAGAIVTERRQGKYWVKTRVNPWLPAQS